ncbi:hypothetical protein EMIT013CA1_10397 [Bacillus sp. IT-13CA1]
MEMEEGCSTAIKERVSQTVSNEVGKRIANNLNISVELKSR